MCLAVPMELIERDAEGSGTAVLGGVRYRTDLSLVPEAQIGDHVIVHAGFAIELLDRQEAEARILLFQQLAAANGED